MIRLLLLFAIARPFGLQVPAGYDRAHPAPLVIALHGYGGNGASFVKQLELDRLAEQRGFLLAYPDGTLDARGHRFWNGSDACCDFYAVDARRIYLIGYSSGGFLAYRYACARARVAALVSLAGANSAACHPKAPVSVLQVHGERDDVVPYRGGRLGLGLPRTGTFPSAKGSLEPWLAADGCTAAERAASADLGTPATILRWTCKAGAVELWSLPAADHFPKLTGSAAAAFWGFLAAHPRK